MNWKYNLSKVLSESEYTDIEIYAWTNISVSTLSNMRNKKHKHFTCEQFILLMKLLEVPYLTFLEEIFGREYFNDIKKVHFKPNQTQLGEIVAKRYKYEVLPKKELVGATSIKSSRLDYIFTLQDSSTRIEEMTKIEIAFGEEPGTLCMLRFSKIKLNNKTTYEKLIEKQRAYNKKANERRASNNS